MRIRAMTLCITFAVILVGSLAPAASAHVGAKIGDLDVEVGFATEPAYVGQPNAVLIQLAEGGRPITNVKDLMVTVSIGDRSSEPMDLEPAWFEEDGEVESGILGEYRAYFIPSVPGAYTFHFVGSVHGTGIDEEFTSGPTSFDEAQDVDAASFPQVNAPTNQELATRIEQEASRTAARVTAASDRAAGARTVGVIGLVAGALGLVTAISAASVVRTSRN